MHKKTDRNDQAASVENQKKTHRNDERQSATLELYDDMCRELTDYLPIMICTFLPDGIITFVNKAYTECFGKRFEELVGSNFLLLIPESERNAVMERIYGLSQENPVISHEHRVIGKDGTIQWQRWSNRAVFDTSGEICRYQAVGEDITRRKQMEEGFLQSENFRKKVLTLSINGIYIYDYEKGTNVYINPQYTQLTGYTLEDLQTMPAERFLSLFHEKEREAILEHMERVAVSPDDSSLEIEYRFKRSDGSWMWCLSKDSVFSRDGTGKVVQMIGTFIDFTEHRKTLEALQTSESKYRAMMESMTDFVGICSSNAVVEYVNPAMIRRLGRNPVGEKCYHAFHDLGERCQWCIMDPVLKGAHGEITMVSPKDGRIYRMLNVPVSNQDGSVSLMAIYRDITDYLAAVEEKKRSQARLRQSQKMEAIGNMAGGIAHDFNNILTAILGFAQLAMDEVGDNLDLKDDIREILTAGGRAKDLIRQILTFARQSDDKLSSIRVDLIANEVLQLVRATIPTSIEIKSSITSQSRILGNVSQVHQIFMNLITNAAFAMEEKGGTLTVSLEDIERKNLPESIEKEDESYIRIRVTDTGIGIPPEIIKSVFDPYFTTKPKDEGTGMGLAVVHGIVEKYRGTILVDSVPGKGTEFSIYLPVTADGSEAVQPSSTNAPSGKESILFVDDEPSIAKVAGRMLGDFGYQVFTETDSLKALERFMGSPDRFDLVITDQTMPGMTGERMAVEMLKIRPDLPVILCTGYSKRMSDLKATELGIRAFVRKPLDFGELSRIIRNILDYSAVSLDPSLL